MDPVTHGITGALLGKGYFSDRYGKAATFAAVLGAIFPDIDVVANVTGDPLAIVKYHRAITHSFVALPFFAFLLALLTRALLPWVRRRFPRWSGVASPPLWVLTVIYGIGIASHILLDGMTSFGTRMWFPLSSQRVAWDLLFIIDFSFTAIVLMPQIIPWVYSAGPDGSRDEARSRRRAVRLWVIFTASTLLIWLLTRAAGYPFRLWVTIVVSAVLALLFFGPAARGWGFRTSRAAWCQAGVLVTVAYLFACAVCHHAAMLRAKAAAEEKHIVADRMGALPIPPSLFDWGDAIRAPDGLYETQFDLRDKRPATFWYVPDSPPDPFIARAFAIANVRLFWQFARFPTIHSFEQDGQHLVDLGENRFSDGRRQGPQPFTYRVVFDDSGDMLEEGWLTDGMLRQRMRNLVPQPRLPGAVPKPKP
ncbi:MAG TPA: metal-dependent hydrolase [Verrucomicrobiae bacterium]|nr:metal-dependent hydrolase [Verrucomicrobiae bacterium]